jgi:rRNA maturation RNase YbeY
MAVTVQGGSIPLSITDVNLLWQLVREARRLADRDVALKSVTRERMRDLYRVYGEKDKATDALTFVYPPLPGEPLQTCDVCVCLPIIEQAAEQAGLTVTAQLTKVLVHAFLHAADMDHERSEEEARAMKKMEQIILGKYRSVALQ